MERMTHERCNGIKTGYWSAATKEELVQRLALYENTGLEPWEIGPAIEKAAKAAETKTATTMAECIAGGIKDTLDELHRARPSLATILVTHHLEELPSSTTHALLIKDGRVHAAGRAQDVLTTGLVSECFDHPIGIEHRAGRWQARALARS